jgi:hypothetical protein
MGDKNSRIFMQFDCVLDRVENPPDRFKALGGLVDIRIHELSPGAHEAVFGGPGYRRDSGLPRPEKAAAGE